MIPLPVGEGLGVGERGEAARHTGAEPPSQPFPDGEGPSSSIYAEKR